MSVNVVTVERPKRSLWVQAYVPEIIKGLSITSKQFFKNLGANLAGRQGDVVTIQYPDVKRDYPERYRGLHRLTYREDGSVRCVACMCCSTICPANCIHIEAAEHEDTSIEKFPQSFVIDELRCIVCGLCVEACPCDAIRMDTGIHTHPYYERDKAFMDKDALLALGVETTAKRGGANKGSGHSH